jgi:hypothetical protein
MGPCPGHALTAHIEVRAPRSRRAPGRPARPARGRAWPTRSRIIRLNGGIDTVIALRIDDGLITGLYVVRNPEKLSHMEQETALRR